MVNQHVMLVSYPAQGHINPASQLANKLIKNGIEVTFVTILHSLGKAIDQIPIGLKLANIPNVPKGFNADHLNALKKHGSKTIRDIIHAASSKKVTLVVYTTILWWVAEVARELHVPCSLLWTQPATVLGIFYHYFHGYEDDFKNLSNDPTWEIQLPGLPSLSRCELPSSILPSRSDTTNLLLEMFKNQFEQLDLEEKSNVLVNTFDDLEFEALRAIEKYNLVAIGPLVPSVTSRAKEQLLDICLCYEEMDIIFRPMLIYHSSVVSHISNVRQDITSSLLLGEDSRKKALFDKDYMQWLCSKPKGSVVYVSFGSNIRLPKPQMEEIGRALLELGSPFLWVIREMENEEVDLKQKGLIVAWCSQSQVLGHPSLGCFITHCGWNSTLESIVFGVPLIAFPQWVDQITNAKLIRDVWKIGEKVKKNANGEVESEEIKKCIELVFHGGKEGQDLKRNCMKWKCLAGEALKEGGSLDKNLNLFLESQSTKGILS